MKEHMLNRREFSHRVTALSAAGLSALSISAYSAGVANKEQMPVALQLYTLREMARENFKGMLEAVAKIGYDAVEFAGYGGLSAQEMKKLLGDLGLRCAGTHVGYGELEKNLDDVIAYNKSIGNDYIVCPSMPGEWREKGADGFKAFGNLLNGIGQKVREADMRFCYHNHSFEFAQESGRYLIDYLLAESDSEYVQCEVDVYWVQYGGIEPVDFLRQHKNRCPLIHMKDMANDEKRSFAPVGAGIMDMNGIVKAARENKAKWFIVEQDSTKRPVLEAIELSLKNMRTLLKG